VPVRLSLAHFFSGNLGHRCYLTLVLLVEIQINQGQDDPFSQQ